MAEERPANEEEEHTNAWQASDNVSQKTSNSDQAADNVKQTAANVAQSAAFASQTEANTKQAAANERHTASHRSRRKINYVQTGVYIFLVFTVCLAFYLNQRNSKEDLIRLCQAGTDTRNVQRLLVQEVYKLNISFIDPKKTYTETERKQIRAFIKNVTKFRANTYAQIKPSELCAPYVTDDNVKPPHTKLPQIKTEGVVNNARH